MKKSSFETIFNCFFKWDKPYKDRDYYQSGKWNIENCGLHEYNVFEGDTFVGAVSEIIEAEKLIKNLIEERMTLKKCFVLTKTCEVFGRTIPRGTVYKQLESNEDYYRPTIISNKIPNECPGLDLHFTNMNNEYFIEIYI